MVASSRWGRTMAALASIGLCMPIVPASAKETAPLQAPIVRNVELGFGGLLVGRLLDANGRPLQDAEVSILTGDKQLAATRTDAEGVFAVSNLRGGVHQITTADSVQLCRLWAPGTAPPQAPKSIDVISDSAIVPRTVRTAAGKSTPEEGQGLGDQSVHRRWCRCGSRGDSRRAERQ